jgi:UDP-N-acetylglucosamine:LPS N-acetylglucosamine transferase
MAHAPTTANNILILTSNTGGGHRSAAQALEESLLRMAPSFNHNVVVTMSQVLEEATAVTRWMADLYNYLLRDHQHWMKYYYGAIQQLKPNESKLIFEAALGYGLKLFERVRPSMIVSVHPMTQHFFAYVLRKLRLLDKIPLVTVVTDPCYGFWKGWACPDVQQYYVASAEAGQQLQDYGIASSKIITSGMPVHNRFAPASVAKKQALRQQMGLDPDRFTVFINAGWIGGGNIPLIYQQLLQSALPIQVVFLAGQNIQLQADAQQLAQVAPFPVKVLGFTNSMDEVMQLSDVMVSKLGGLTTFEALACQLPVIADVVTPPMPQEEQTAQYIASTGTGLLLHRQQDIIPVIQHLTTDPTAYQLMRTATATHGILGSADVIAKGVLGAMGCHTSAAQMALL